MNVDVQELRDLVEHRTRKLDAARLGELNERIIKLRTEQLDEAKKQYAAAIAAQQKG